MKQLRTTVTTLLEHLTTTGRTPRLTIALALFLGAAVAFAAAAVAYAIRAAHEATAAEGALSARDLAAAAIVKEDRAPDLAMLLALEAYSHVDDQSAERSYDARNALLLTLERNARLRTVLHSYQGKADALAFSPDGRTVAVASSLGSGNDSVRLWDVRSGARIGKTLRTHVVRDLAFTADGSALVASGYDPRSTGALLSTFDVASGAVRGKPLDITPFIVSSGKRSYDDPGSTELSDGGRFAVSQGTHGSFTVWDVARRKPVLNADGYISPVEWSLSRDGRFLAVREYGELTVWDLSRGKSVVAPTGNVNAVAFSPRGPMLAVGAQRKIILWDVARGRRARAPLSREGTGALAFSPDGRVLASAHARGRVVLWDLTAKHPRPGPVRGRGEVSGLEFSPNGRTLQVARSSEVTYVDVARRAPLVSPPRVTGLSAFSPDGTVLATAGNDGTVRIWDLTRTMPLEGSVYQRPNPEQCCEYAKRLAFGADGHTFASGSEDGAVKLWDLRQPARPAQLIGRHDDFVRTIAFSPEGRKLVSVAEYDQVRLWDVVRRAELAALPPGGIGHGEGDVFEVDISFMDAAFTPDGSALAAADDDGTIRFWDAETREPLKTLRDPGEYFALSPDGRLLAAGWLLDRTVRLWDVDRGEPVGPPLSSGEGLWDLAFSPDGKTFSAAGTDGAVHVWRISAGVPHAIGALPAGTETLFFTPDGSTLVTENGTIRMWDIARSRPLGDPLPGSDATSASAVSPDGPVLVTSHGDGTIRSWDPLLLSRDLDAWRARFCPVVRRNLSRYEWRRYVGDEPYRKTCTTA